MSRTLTASTHHVEEGESLASIAEASGFFELTLWNLPENSSLRSRRKRPTVLAPGDAVVIPELRRKQAPVSTDARHVFRRRGVPAVYRLRLIRDGKAVSGAAYTFSVGGRKREGATDAQGCLKEFIPPEAKEGLLRVPSIGLRARVLFGYLDPIDDMVGIQKRLKNLGYLKGEPTGSADHLTHQALRAFQFVNGLKETGDCDAATRAALEKAHDFPH